MRKNQFIEKHGIIYIYKIHFESKTIALLVITISKTTQNVLESFIIQKNEGLMKNLYLTHKSSSTFCT